VNQLKSTQLCISVEIIIKISPYYKTHIQIDKFLVTAAAATTAATTAAAAAATTAVEIYVNYLPTTLLYITVKLTV
jgi:hypothetical protein